MENNAFVVTAVVFEIVIGLLVLAQLVALAVLAMMMKNLVVQISEHIDPLIEKTNSLLIVANEIAQTVQDKTERIADKAATTTDRVAERADATSKVVHRAITTPIIQSAGFVAGVQAAMRQWCAARAKRMSPPTQKG